MVDEGLAIHEVREFAARVETADGMWHPLKLHYDDPNYKRLAEEIHKQLPLIKDIAREFDPKLETRIDHGVNYGSGFGAALSATNELLGFLETADRRAAILGVKGPRLALSSMHLWVHGAAAQLWDDGHHREAVTTAASAIFNTYLPAKVEMPKGTQPDAMLGKAFKGESPFLNNPGFETPGQDRTNAYEGAQNLDLACAKLVRNLATHNGTAPRDENELLEELAMLSRFARIIDSSTV
jgi:hypothetical protein